MVMRGVFRSGLVVLAGVVLGTGSGVAQDQGAAPQPQPLDLPDDWDQRDLEAKWVWYRRDRAEFAADPHRLSTWAHVLEARGEDELLEAIAIHEGWKEVGPALGRMKSPRWIRVAIWNHHSLDSHDQENARDWINRHKEEVLAWFEKYPVAQRGHGAILFRQLQNQLGKSRAVTDALPPLDPHQVLLPYLDAPPELAQFGEALQADPRTRYVHQVLRALDGVSQWGRADEMAVEKVYRLTRHGMRPIQIRAFETLSKLPGALTPRDELWATVRDPSASDFLRQWSVLALASSQHPETELQLLEVARDVRHPGWSNAVARLGDVGGPYALEVLPTIELPGQTSVEMVAHAQARLGGRLGDPARKNLHQQAGMLLAVVWAEGAEHPEAGALRDATVRWFRSSFGAAGLASRLDAVLGSTALDAYVVFSAEERAKLREGLVAWRASLDG